MDDNPDNFAELLLRDKDSSAKALLFNREECSYGDLRRLTAQVACFLHRSGGQKGDRVILVGENSVFWVSAYLGAMRAGLICVPLSADLSPDEFDFVLRQTEARVVFAQTKFAVRAGAKLEHLHVVTNGEAPLLPGVAAQHSFAALNAESTGLLPFRPATEPDDLAALMFTSGSTGKPRGVMVSHANLIANTESIIDYLGLTSADKGMAVLPFHYCYGASLLHTHLHVGGQLVVDSRFMYPESVLQRMIDTECTGFAGVPSHFQILLRSSSLAKRKFPQLRYVQQAGGGLAPAFVRELRAALPGTQIYIMYGQTEATARLSYLPPSLLDTKLGSIGKGIPGVELRVLNESGLDVRPGEVGEIVATGRNVARGYWRDPEESASSFRDGRLFTGDLATIDDEGFIFIVDRTKDFLKCRGQRVSCRQIEEQLLAFEGLLEAAVLPVPDEVMGEAVLAVIVGRQADNTGLAGRLAVYCRQHMPAELVPREIIVLPTLPKNSSGKVLKPKLRELVSACKTDRPGSCDTLKV